MSSDVASNDVGMLCEPSRRPQVAALKRIHELWMMDREFHDEYLANPARAIAGTGLEVDPRAVSLLLLICR